MHRLYFTISLFTCLLVSAFSQPKIDRLKVWQSDIEEGDLVSITSYITDETNDLVYTWDFGDGKTKQVFNDYSVGHIYEDDGSYTIKLTIEDQEGHTDSKSIQAKVSNTPPKIHFANGTEEEGGDLTVQFEAVVYDPGKESLIYKWDFGDGNNEEVLNLDKTSHRYEEKGFYTVTLIVDDQDGGVDSYSFVIVVDQDWGAKLSGAIRDSISGGSAFFYFKNEENGICYKMITLYDDASQSILAFEERSKKGITNREFNLTYDSQGSMNAGLSYEIMSGVYGAAKATSSIWDQATDMSLLFETLGQASPTELAKGIEEARAKDDMGIDFKAIGGKLKTSTLKGNKFTGEYTILMNEILPYGSKQKPKLIDVIGTFEIEANKYSYIGLENGCENVPDEFTLVNHTPSHNQKNIHPQYPCIEMEFSEKVDANLADHSNITIGFFHKNGNFLKIPLVFEQISEYKIKAIPTQPLMNGVKYAVRVRGGDNGFKSIEGGELPLDYAWEFGTLVKVDDYKIRVYQTIQDKPLIPGKNTLVRAIFDWEKPEIVAERSFVKEFKATVSLKSQGGEKVCGDIHNAVFKHQKYVTGDQIMLASNSVNIYDWKPKKDNGDVILVEALPDFQDCVPNDKRDPFVALHSIEHWEKKLELKTDYYFLKMSEWRDSVPQEMIEMGDRAMANAANFSAQIFPIKSLNTSNKGPINIDWQLYLDPAENITAELIGVMWNGSQFNDALEDIKNDILQYSSADIVILFHPELPGFSTGQTLSHSPNKCSEPKFNYNSSRPLIRMTLNAKTIVKAGIEHEIGHAFGLSHEPCVSGLEDKGMVGEAPLGEFESVSSHDHMYGFRLNQNSNGGSNKNCDEGNAQSETFINLMFPDLSRVDRIDQFISGNQYSHLIEDFDQFYGSRLVYEPTVSYNHSGLANLRSSVFDFISMKPIQEFILVTGEIIDEEKAKINKIHFRDMMDLPLTPAGEYSLLTLNKEDKILNDTKFDPNPIDYVHGVNFKGKRFSVFIPFREGIQTFRIVKGGEILYNYSISKNKPQVSFLEFNTNMQLTSNNNEVRWKGEDPDGDDLVYTLFYSPNGIEDWQLLGKTRSNSLMIDPNQLIFGPAPSLKIEANDGYHRSSDRIRIKLESNLKIDSYGPKEALNESGRIYIKFRSPVQEKLLLSPGRILMGEKNKQDLLPVRLEYVPFSNTVFIDPIKKLEKGVPYVVVLSKLGLFVTKKVGKLHYKQGETPLKDIYGNELEKDLMFEFIKN